MGLGIEARYLRCKEYWKRHLDLSKEFQIRCLEGISGDSIAVFGAGRLLDLPAEKLAGMFREIHFFDADPTLAGTWEDFRRRLRQNQALHSHLIDVTGVLEHWTAEMNQIVRGKQQGSLRDCIAFLTSAMAKAPEVPQMDCSISLNILSQLGIYWRERVEKLIAVHRPAWLANDEQMLPELQQALADSIRRLEEAHLVMLGQSTRSTIIVLSDISFLYYERNRSHWQCEPALELKGEILIDGFKLRSQDTWLWHIAPQGLEQDDHGAIHQVQARCFQRS